MWGIALMTLVATAHLRLRLGDGWRALQAAEAVVGLAGIVITNARWRGRVVPGFLLVGGCLCVLKTVQVLTSA